MSLSQRCLFVIGFESMSVLHLVLCLLNFFYSVTNLFFFDAIDLLKKLKLFVLLNV